MIKNTYKQCHGFTLIELIIFIIVVGVIASGLIISYQQILTGSSQAREISRTAELAQQRMDLILGQKYENGYRNFSDPCGFGSPPSVCTLPSGYSVIVTGLPVSTSAATATISVEITSPNGLSETVTTVVGNY